SRAYCITTPPPADHPNRWRGVARPIVSTRASRSSEKSRMPRVASIAFRSDPPKPRKSGAITWKSSANSSIRSSKKRLDETLPCTRTTTGRPGSPAWRTKVANRGVSMIDAVTAMVFLSSPTDAGRRPRVAGAGSQQQDQVPALEATLPLGPIEAEQGIHPAHVPGVVQIDGTFCGYAESVTPMLVRRPFHVDARQERDLVEGGVGPFQRTLGGSHEVRQRDRVEPVLHRQRIGHVEEVAPVIDRQLRRRLHGSSRRNLDVERERAVGDHVGACHLVAAVVAPKQGGHGPVPEVEHEP